MNLYVGNTSKSKENLSSRAKKLSDLLYIGGHMKKITCTTHLYKLGLVVFSSVVQGYLESSPLVNII